MKLCFRRGLAALAAVALLGAAPALAAEPDAPSPAIAVQLDGQNLVFPDAVPQVKEERTFLPFRAVFEAMGAQVDYSASANTVTAKRGGTTVTMALGGSVASVEKDGVTTQVDMGVAPYAAADENNIWRTYVPVRAATEAFGCAVGWDQDAGIAVIVDVEKLVDNALEGKHFTYLEKLEKYQEKYTQGIWDTEMKMDGLVSLMGTKMPLAVSAAGVTEGESKMDLDMTMTLDMSELEKLFKQTGAGELTDEEKAVLDSLAADGIGIRMRGDVLDAGTLYLNINGEFLDEAMKSEVSAAEWTQMGESMDNVWFSMDMNELMAMSGVDTTWSEYVAGIKDMDYVGLAKALLSQADVNSAATGYSGLKSTVEQIVNALSDEGFTKKGNEYTSTLRFEEEGAEAQIVCGFTMKNNAVVSYDVSFTMSVTDPSMDEAVTMDLSMGVDEKDQLSGKLTMNMEPLMSIELNISGNYAKGSKAPQLTPPEGAVILPLAELM